MSERPEQKMFYPGTWNAEEKVMKQFQVREPVEILDLTLDENGEGMVGAYLDREQKITVAKMLDSLGVQRLATMGFPEPVSEEEVNIAREISDLGLNAKFQSLASTKEDIERAVFCNVWGVIIRKPVSDLYMVPEEHSVARKIEDCVKLAYFAKEKGLTVSIMAQDITRAKSSMAQDIILGIHEKIGLDELCLADSQGVANPFGMKHLVETVKSWIAVPIQVHCHNHIGLGLANSCAAVAGGAQIVHTTVCGLGHYAGMTALEEVSVALAVGFGIDIGIQNDRLYELAKTIESFTGITIQPHKAIVGNQAFVKSEEAKDIKALQDVGRLELHKRWFPFLPEFVGQKSRVIMAEKVVREAIEYNLGELGIQMEKQSIDKILLEVRNITRRERRILSDSEFQKIISGLVS